MTAINHHLLGTVPGDVLMHRNVANLVVHSDVSLLSVLQYAVQDSGSKTSSCAGITDAVVWRPPCRASCGGLLNSWLTHIRDVVRLPGPGGLIFTKPMPRPRF